MTDLTPPLTGDPLVDLLNGGPVLAELDLNEQDMLALFVAEELRGRLVRRLGLAGQLFAARIAAEVVDGYSREQIEQAQEDDEPDDAEAEHGLNVGSGSWMCKCGTYCCPKATPKAKRRPSACPTHGSVLDCPAGCEGRQ